MLPKVRIFFEFNFLLLGLFHINGCVMGEISDYKLSVAMHRRESLSVVDDGWG